MTGEARKSPADGGWAPLAVTLAIQALVSMAMLALPAIAPAVAKALGTSPAYTGLYVALAYAAAMVSSLASGTAIARWGAIRVSQAGLTMAAGGLLLSTLGVLPGVAAGAVLLGLGYGPITPASSHLLARTTPAHRMSMVFSLKQTGVPLGGAMAGALVPGLLLLLGWQGALLAVGAACLLCAAIAQPLREGLDADRNPAQRLATGNLAQPVRLVFSYPGLRRLALCSFAFSILQLSLTTYTVTYLDDALAYGLVAAGAALSLSQAGGVVGRVAWGYVSDRWLGARRMLVVLAWLMAFSALATAMLQPAVPRALVLAVLMLFGASAIGWNGVFLAEVARQAPSGQAGQATGGTLAITFLGVVLGPPAFSALAFLSGSYRPGFVALALVALACGLVLRRAPPASA